jgi:hypothetical protein
MHFMHGARELAATLSGTGEEWNGLTKNINGMALPLNVLICIFNVSGAPLAAPHIATSPAVRAAVQSYLAWHVTSVRALRLSVHQKRAWRMPLRTYSSCETHDDHRCGYASHTQRWQ